MLDSSYRSIISYAIFHHFAADDRDDILKGRKLNAAQMMMNASFLTRMAFKIQLWRKVPKHGMMYLRDSPK